MGGESVTIRGVVQKRESPGFLSQEVGIFVSESSGTSGTSAWQSGCICPDGMFPRVLPIIAYTCWLRPNGVLYQASGIWKGRGFTSWSMWMGGEICHFSCKKAQKGWQIRYILCLWKSRKNVLFLLFKLLGMLKGYHLSMEGIRKGYLSSQKFPHKKDKGWISGRSLQVTNKNLSAKPTDLNMIFTAF